MFNSTITNSKYVNFSLSVSLLDIHSHGHNWLTTTNFVTDRLRAVRQDLVIQHLSAEIAVPILEIIVRYHIFVRYVLYRESIHAHDPTLNDQLLNSYLSDLHGFYETQEDEGPNMDEFQSYLVLSNLKSQQFCSQKMKEALVSRKRALYLKESTRDANGKSRIEFALSMFVNFQIGNFNQFFRQIYKLQFLERCCLLYTSTEVRVAFLNVISTAYNSKHFKFSMQTFTDWLLFDNVEESVNFLKHFQFAFDENDAGSVCFREKKAYVLETSKEIQDLTKKFSFNRLLNDGVEVRITDARSIVVRQKEVLIVCDET